jgi:hypothetical protein
MRPLMAGLGVYALVVLVALMSSLMFVDSDSRALMQALGTVHVWPPLPNWPGT